MTWLTLHASRHVNGAGLTASGLSNVFTLFIAGAVRIRPVMFPAAAPLILNETRAAAIWI